MPSDLVRTAERPRPRAFEAVPLRDPALAPAALEGPDARGTAALCRAARRIGGAAVLDSVAGRPRHWSLVAFDPVERLEGTRSIAELAARLAGFPALPVEGPFAGGFVGALAYDLGLADEGLDLPPPPWPGPPIAGGLFTDHVWIDHRRGTAELRLADVEHDPRPPLAVRRARALDAIATALAEDPPAEGAWAPRAVGPLRRHTPAAEHRRRIEALRESIRCGDVYQANLAHRFTVAVEGDPLELYLRLRRTNPAPHAGYLDLVEADGRPRALLSSSPELLLAFDGERARTRPIKGTAPRGADPAADRAAAEGLLASVKDRAELAMIVDLARNDLGARARPGEVTVGTFPELESYAAVHHLVAEVAARVRPGVDACALLASLFPGASITGAPKAAAMEAIAALEGEGRGFFTGSLGFVDARGRAHCSILIRTLEWRAARAPGAGPGGAASVGSGLDGSGLDGSGLEGSEPAPLGGEVSLSVGGGITWDSDPAAEVEETHHKARALLAALGLEPTGRPERAERAGR